MKVNGSRVRQHLVELAALGRKETGICRLAYSDEFWKSNEYIAGLMREAGMTVRTNPVGNVVGTYLGKSDHKIVMGSHIDSVVNGGMFDGCLGVIAAIEAVQTLHENGVTPEHTIDVVAYAEEEGLTVAGLLGSRAYCGLEPTPVMLERMGSYGITPKDFAEAKEEAPLDYALELHIEQGGILEHKQIDIGVVSAIVAIKRYAIEFSGMANHAGTTPMTLRDDAMVRAARFIQRVREIVMETDPEMVGTVGHVEVFPNTANTIPGKVCVILELRAIKDESVSTAYEQILEEFQYDIASSQLIFEDPCYRMDPTVRAAIHKACGELGLSNQDMGSGAGHDSMSTAQVTKTGMIFVPSAKGISHSPDELTSWQDAENGANVLLHSLCILDRKSAILKEEC